MRAALLFAILGLAGCGFRSTAAGAGSGDGAPDSGSGKTTVDDLDGDGVPNDGDNCPTTANADQLDGDKDGVGDVCDNCPTTPNPRKATPGFDHPVQRDHDGDGRGDECDLCPHLASTSDTDADGDGIGDACDPEKNTKNPPAYFNGFYDPPDKDWSVPAGAGALADWTVVKRADGTVGWQQTVLDGSKRHQILHAGERLESYIDVVMVIDAVADADGNALRGAGPTTGFYPTGTGDYYFNCGVRRDVSANLNTMIPAAYRDDTYAANTMQSYAGFALGKRIRVVGLATRQGGGGQPRMGNTDLSCDLDDGAKLHGELNNVNLFPDGTFGLRTFGARAWFDYVFFVEPVPAP